MSAPAFLYLDLGNVILSFDNQKACRQMSAVTGMPEGQLRDFFGVRDYQRQLELGRVTLHEVHAALCDELERDVDAVALERAYADIFGLLPGIVPVVARLAIANVRLGILSNTSAPHWDLITDGRFAILPSYFEQQALSFEIGAMKPQREIFAAAEKLAGVGPSSIFFTDDRKENVEAARAAGWDAVQFESPAQLAEELHARGVRFNY